MPSEPDFDTVSRTSSTGGASTRAGSVPGEPDSDAVSRTSSTLAVLTPRGAFSLDAALRFLDRFAPAGAAGQGEAYAGAHVVDDRPALVRATQRADGGVEVTPAGAGPLVWRMFCLDWDGDAFAALPDPVLAAVRERHPGLRPVLFASPWEALVWAIVGHRISMAQAARLKDGLRDALGPEVEGRRAFPPPAAVLEHGVPVRLPDVKVERLLALAERGAAGELEADALRAMPAAEAQAWLERSPGIGPWSSAFVLIRGAGFPDLLPAGERRLEDAIARHYGAGADFAQVAAGWAPFRAWAAFLFRADAG